MTNMDTQSLIDQGLVDPNNKEFTLLTGALVERDLMMFLEFPDAFSKVKDEVEISYVTGWDGQNLQQPWLQTAKQWEGVSCCVWRNYPNERLYVSLSRDGHVFMSGPGGKTQISEEIPGTGRSKPWSNGRYGTVNRIRNIGSSLYVVGSDRSVYRRQSNAGWKDIATAIRVDMQPFIGTDDFMSNIRNFQSIAGRNDSDIYCVGLAGEIFHYNGVSWKQVESGTNKHILDVYCASDGFTYAIGSDGTFLFGRHDLGFGQVAAPIDDKSYITGIAEFDGGIWLATGRGIYRFDMQDRSFSPIKTDLTPDLIDHHHLDAGDGVLWSIGFKDLAWFDGIKWTRLDHPENPKIR